MLCNPLCFLIRRYGRDTVKQLKCVLADFYSAADLSDAKSQLLKDAKRVDKNDSIPHVPDRREGELRSVRIIDDIFTVLYHLDHSQLLKCLPKYVADSPDAMPSTRFYEGDLAILMELLKRMDGQIEAGTCHTTTTVSGYKCHTQAAGEFSNTCIYSRFAPSTC